MIHIVSINAGFVLFSLRLMVFTGLFNYYTSFVMEPGSEVTYEVYALESTGPRCEGYYLQWNISTSPYSVSFEVK